MDNIVTNSINVVYSYNTDISCQETSDAFNSVMQVSFHTMLCLNVVSLMRNSGQIQMDDTYIDIEIHGNENHSINSDSIVQFRYLENKIGLFQNTGDMTITNMVLGESVHDTVFLNEGTLVIHNFSFDSPGNISYDPTELRSNKIITWTQRSTNCLTEVYIYNAHFVGSHMQLAVLGGIARIFNSVFEHSFNAIVARDMHEFVMSNCKIINNGRYNGQLQSDLYYEYQNSAIQINANAIFLSNNYISAFDTDPLLNIYEAVNISLINNTFYIDYMDIFWWNVSIYPRAFGNYAPILIHNCTDTSLVGNIFNTHPFATEWILYWNNYGLNCLSGNVFYNDAFFAYHTNITSCFRPELIDCLHSSVKCSETKYGYVEQDLFNYLGRIVIDGNFRDTYRPAMILAFESMVALDNVELIAADTIKVDKNSHVWIIKARKACILIVDSYISNGYDVSYYDNTDVLINDRLEDQTNYITSLLLQTMYDVNSTDFHRQSLHRTMDSPITEFVSHFSVIKINFTTKSCTYFPGQLLQFQYTIMDRFGNIINYTRPDGITVFLESEDFLITFEINPNGECPRCDAGVLLNVISISEHIGGTYQMNVFFENNLFIPEYPILSIDIVGCPIGYEPDLNNFTCGFCNTGYYNLETDNVNECKSCDPSTNIGIKCNDGNIWVSKNYWVGVDMDNNFISSFCPSQYCCTNENGCNYLDENSVTQLCSKYRNYTSELCSKCIDGYSESMNSSNCVKCDQQYHLEYLLFPICIAFLYVIFLLGTNTDKIKQTEQNLEVKSKWKIKQIFGNKDFQLMTNIMIFKNLLYYEQGLIQIIHTSPVEILFDSLAAIFNLSIVQNKGGKTGNLWCFIDGLNAKHKILVDLLVPLLIVLLIGFIYFLSKCIFKKGISFKNNKVNFGKAFISTYLVIIGAVLSVLFQLLNCKKLGDVNVHFYFAFEQCYGATWIVSFIFLIMIVLSFGMICIKLKRMEISERQNSINSLNVITAKFKQKCYYWEVILFIRRIIIALFSVSINNITWQYVFLAVISLFILIQHKYIPFVIEQPNELEFILLICLPLVIMSQIPSQANGKFINFMISFLIVIPFPLMIYYMYTFSKKILGEKTTYDVLDNADNDEKQETDDKDHNVKTAPFEIKTGK